MSCLGSWKGQLKPSIGQIGYKILDPNVPISIIRRNCLESEGERRPEELSKRIKTRS